MDDDIDMSMDQPDPVPVEENDYFCPNCDDTFEPEEAQDLGHVCAWCDEELEQHG